MGTLVEEEEEEGEAPTLSVKDIKKDVAYRIIKVEIHLLFL